MDVEFTNTKLEPPVVQPKNGRRIVDIAEEQIAVCEYYAQKCAEFFIEIDKIKKELLSQKESKMDIEKEKATSVIESHYAAIDAFVKSLIDKGVNPEEVVLDIRRVPLGEHYSVRKMTDDEIQERASAKSPEPKPVLTLHRCARGYLYLQAGEITLRLDQEVTDENARNFIDAVNGIDHE